MLWPPVNNSLFICSSAVRGAGVPDGAPALAVRVLPGAAKRQHTHQMEKAVSLRSEVTCTVEDTGQSEERRPHGRGGQTRVLRACGTPRGPPGRTMPKGHATGPGWREGGHRAPRGERVSVREGTVTSPWQDLACVLRRGQAGEVRR